MNLTELQKLCALETGNQLQHTFLITELQMVLKAHQVVTVCHQIFLPQLYGCVRNSAGSWIDQSYRFHRTKTQRVAATSGHLFDWQAAFKVLCVFETVQRHLFGRHKSI